MYVCEATCRAKEERRTGERKKTAILRRRGRADEALESRREQLRRHFRVCMVITYSKSMDQPGKVANPVRGQVNGGNEKFPVPVGA